MKSLLHFEQYVNDRFGTSDPPGIAESLLPENGSVVPLHWRKVPVDSVSVFSTGSHMAEQLVAELRRNGEFLIPVHPLDEGKWPRESLVNGGAFQVTSSYRTVAYAPSEGDLLSASIPDNHTLMIKLHLEEPLPGIPGDRRLTRDKVEKCVLLSQTLAETMQTEPLAQQLRIVPEFLGIVSDDCGALFRLLPSHGLVPAFSLGSRDTSEPGSRPLIVDMLETHYGDDVEKAALEFGEQFALPLIRSLFAGFRAGFSLEMHAQNTLVEPGRDRLISTVHYRDLEGVILSNSFRSGRNLPELFTNTPNSEYCDESQKFSRLFNRNYDHDLGRIFLSVLSSLHSCGYFDQKQMRTAMQGIRLSFRSALRKAELSDLAGLGRVVPFSRAPYGDGFRLGHYFRTQFR